MAVRSRTFYVGALAALLSLLLVFSWGTVEAQDNGGAATEGDDGTELTAKQRAEFARGAKKVAGLSDAEISQVFKYPGLINEIPVSVRRSSKVVDPLRADSGADSLIQATATEECVGSVVTVRYNDVFGQAVFKFIVTKRWCTDGQRVTYGNMNDVQTWIRSDSQYQPETGGWRYVPSAEFGTEQFQDFNGHNHGAHKSTRAGKFELLFPSTSEAAGLVYPAVIQTARYTGVCVSSTYSPSEPWIKSGPSDLVRSTTATFTFAYSPDPGTTFECNRDGNGAIACSSPKTYVSLVEGGHNFRLQAVNSSGNALPKPPAHIWTVDLTAPQATSVVPGAGTTGVAANTNVEAVFSEDIDELTLFGGSLTLVEQGTGNSIDGFISYNPGGTKVILNPYTNLAPGSTYTATVRGEQAE